MLFCVGFFFLKAGYQLGRANFFHLALLHHAYREVDETLMLVLKGLLWHHTSFHFLKTSFNI